MTLTVAAGGRDASAGWVDAAAAEESKTTMATRTGNLTRFGVAAVVAVVAAAVAFGCGNVGSTATALRVQLDGGDDDGGTVPEGGADAGEQRDGGALDAATDGADGAADFDANYPGALGDPCRTLGDCEELLEAWRALYEAWEDAGQPTWPWEEGGPAVCCGETPPDFSSPYVNPRYSEPACVASPGDSQPRCTVRCDTAFGWGHQACIELGGYSTSANDWETCSEGYCWPP